MEKDVLNQISKKIKHIRKSRDITLQELADKVKVSKALLSQVERKQTAPSLLLLIQIVKAFDMDVNEFFGDIDLTNRSASIVIKRSREYAFIKEEKAKGLSHKRILSRNISKGAVDFTFLEVDKHLRRPTFITTVAFEYKYLINGIVEYELGGKKYLLHAGDSLFFDGRLEHAIINIAEEKAVVLEVSFYEGSK